MKILIAIGCFATGAITLGLTLVWYSIVLWARHPMWPFPSGILWIEVLFAFGAAVMFATFYRSPKPLWTPLITITTKRVQRSRFLFAAAFLNVLIWLLLIAVFSIARLQRPIPWLFCLFACSCFLLNSIYLCIHWALRPENIFSERFRRFADDPILFGFITLINRRGRIK